MAFTRRGFIRTFGGGMVAAAGLAVGLKTCDSMPPSAVAPWQGPAPGESDPRRRALAFAQLAPNPHNLQPWLVDLRRSDEILLHVDRSRLLPETDPFGRQITIGHGCFLELLQLAAGAEGWQTRIAYFPDGEPEPGRFDDRPLARVAFSRGAAAAPDPLAAQILHRRSAKEPYGADPLRPDHAAALIAAHRAAAGTLAIETAPERVARLRHIIEAAMLIEIETPRTYRESVDVMRIGAEAIAANPDGVDLHGPFFWWMRRLGLFTPEKAMTPGTLAYQGAIDYAQGWARATPAFGWLTTAGNGRVDQIEAGRGYVRLNLAATAAGVAMHPVSQVLQEYPEMAPLQRDFRTQIGAAEGQTVQMLFRLGYAARPAPAPRRPLSELLLS